MSADVTTVSSTARAAGPASSARMLAAGECAVRLHGGEDLERAVPVAVERVDALVDRSRGVDDERRTPPSARVRLEDRAGGADGELEARIGRVTHDQRRSASRSTARLVPRRVLQLLDHQVAAPGRRRPVHAPQRLALLVVADAVEVEAARPPQQQPPPLRRPRTGLGEEPVDVDEPRVDEDRRPRGELDVDALEAEGVLDDDLGLLDRIAAARHAPEQVAAAQATVRGGRAASRGSPRRAIFSRRTSVPEGMMPSVSSSSLDRHVVAGQPLAAPERPPQRHRPPEEAHPERRGERRRGRARSRPDRGPAEPNAQAAR